MDKKYINHNIREITDYQRWNYSQDMFYLDEIKNSGFYQRALKTKYYTEI